MENHLQFIKKDVRKITLNLLLYLGIFLGIATIFYIIQSAFIEVEEFLVLPESAYEVILNLDGFGYILGGIIAVWVFYGRQKISFKSVLQYRKGKMTVEWFVMLTIILMSFQFFFNVSAMGLEWLLNQFGLSTLRAVEAAQAQEDTFMMALYAGFMGPIFEELAMRGGMTLRLERYGKVPAIVISALFFGLFHMNFIQGIFAFVTGLLLAFVCLEFGFIWAVILHIWNNFGFGVILTESLLFLFGEQTTEVFMQIIQVVCFVAAIFILGFYRSDIKKYMQKNKAEKGTYRTIFTIIPVWIFIILCLLMSIGGITQLNG